MNANSQIKDFYGRDFIISPDVLIPRPETEQVIDAVLNLAGKPYLPGVKPSQRKISDTPTILDIGTGSGCIAITLKKELPNANVIATDISEKALKIAQENAKKHGVSIDFILSDLLDKVKSTPEVLIANLPYVDKGWGWLDLKSLAKEPSIALFAEDHGLALIKRLIKQAQERNIKYLVLEADPCQHENIIKFAKNYNYELEETRGFVLLFVSFKS